MTPTELKTLANKHRGTDITFYEAWQQELPPKTLFEAIGEATRPYYLYCDCCDAQAFFINREAVNQSGWTLCNGSEFCPEHSY